MRIPKPTCECLLWDRLTLPLHPCFFEHQTTLIVALDFIDASDLPELIVIVARWCLARRPANQPALACDFKILSHVASNAAHRQWIDSQSQHCIFSGRNDFWWTIWNLRQWQ